MAKTTPPADERQAPDEQLATGGWMPGPGETPPGPRFWRYSGPERTYTHIPVTVQDGDVIEHTFAVPPADDGCWEPCDGPATVHPDNHGTTDSAGA